MFLYDGYEQDDWKIVAEIIYNKNDCHICV